MWINLVHCHESVTAARYHQKMDDLDIGATVMDFHPEVGEADSPEAEMGAEYARMAQALLAAGIDIKSLTPMDRARVKAALWSDNQLFEESGAMIAMYRQSYGLLDAMHHTEEEIVEETKARISDEIAVAEEAEQKMKAKWAGLNFDLMQAFQFDWDIVSKNMVALFYTLDDLKLSGAGEQEIQTEMARFHAATPMVPGKLGQADPQYYLGRQHLIDQTHFERLVQGDVRNSLQGILNGFNATAETLDVPQNSWVSYVRDRRQPQRGIEEIAAKENPAAAPQPEDWRGKVTAEALEALLPKEAQMS